MAKSFNIEFDIKPRVPFLLLRAVLIYYLKIPLTWLYKLEVK